MYVYIFDTEWNEGAKKSGRRTLGRKTRPERKERGFEVIVLSAQRSRERTGGRNWDGKRRERDSARSEKSNERKRRGAKAKACNSNATEQSRSLGLFCYHVDLELAKDLMGGKRILSEKKKLVAVVPFTRAREARIESPNRRKNAEKNSQRSIASVRHKISVSDGQ